MERNINEDKARHIIDNLLMQKDISAICCNIKEYSSHLFRHSTDVAFISAQIALNLGISEYGVGEIVTGALLHDSGKMMIPKDILDKPGKLTPAEYETIKMHPLYGYKLAEEYFFSDVIKDIILHHHENESGDGYPDGSTDISLETMIVSIADKYDAMTSKRSYKNAYDKYTAFVKMGAFQLSSKYANTIYRALSQCNGI